MSKPFFFAEIYFDGWSRKLFSREFNFANCPYFPRDRENFFLQKLLPIKFSRYIKCFDVQSTFHDILHCPMYNGEGHTLLITMKTSIVDCDNHSENIRDKL